MKNNLFVILLLISSNDCFKLDNMEDLIKLNEFNQELQKESDETEPISPILSLKDSYVIKYI